MSRPYRENLEFAEHQGRDWIQCSRCGHRLAPSDENWRGAAITRQLPPDRMGPYRELMQGRMVLEEVYCPKCGVTFDAAVVNVAAEAPVAVRPATRKGRCSTEPVPITLDAAATAIIALDLQDKACAPTHVGHAVLAAAPQFFERARAAGVHVVFVVPAWDKGSSEDHIAQPLRRRESEPIIYPHAYDKFHGGELQALLQGWGVKNIIFMGGSLNFSALYTSSTATRVHGYTAVIPLDGVYAHSDYEMEYALFHFTVIPRVQDKYRFTRLSEIAFV